MDHTYQSTMLMPASYAVLSEEEMTYLDGGADYSFNVGDRLVDVTGNGRFRACPAKEAAIAPHFLIHTASPSATESAKEFL